MRNLVYGFSGRSNSGKTTLIVRLVRSIGGRVVVIKHDPKGKARIDCEGKDSDLFFRAGADVALLSPKETTLRLHGALNLAHVLQNIGECDFIFVEGLRHLPIPKLAMMREEIDPDYLGFVDAIVVGDGVDCSGVDVAVLHIDCLDSIIAHIKTHALDKESLLQKLKEAEC